MEGEGVGQRSSGVVTSLDDCACIAVAQSVTHAIAWAAWRKPSVPAVVAVPAVLVPAAWTAKCQQCQQ